MSYFFAIYRSHKGGLTQLGRFVAKDAKDAIGIAWRRAYAIVGKIDEATEGGRISTAGYVEIQSAARPTSEGLRRTS